MKKFSIKFFGSKNRKEQIKQIKMFIQVPNRSEVETLLRHKYGYEVINGLKIREVEDEE